ncbi:MAG: hypothetical protein GX234_01890 [Clostridiales bacterium]|nr:hypothetical protein [Clostridiales bacterium]
MVYFYILFFCLRLCVGGYHAPTFHSCFIISNIIFLMILGMTELSVKIFQLKSMEILFYVVAMVYIDYRMPQRARWEGICNKKISKKRIQERWLFGVQLCGILYMYINPNVNSRYMNCAIIATFAVAVMIIPIKEEKQDEASTKVSIKGS